MPVDPAGRPRAGGEPDAGLEVTVGTQRRRLRPGETLTIGRDPEAGLRTDDPYVSRVHVLVGGSADGWVITDLSRNGVYLASQRVTRLAITRPTIVALGRADGIHLTIVPIGDQAPPQRTVVHRSREPGSATLRTDRSPSAVHDTRSHDSHRADARQRCRDRRPTVSRYHAECPAPDAVPRLVDLGKRQRHLRQRERVAVTELQERDIVGIGHALLELVEGSWSNTVTSGTSTSKSTAWSSPRIRASASSTTSASRSRDRACWR